MPIGYGQAQNDYTSILGGLGQYNTYNIPQYQGIAQQAIGDPNAQSALAGAGGAAGLGQQAALGMYGAGQGLYGAGQQLYGTAFDPQQDLYNRTLQQVTQQSRAGQAARGILTSPYGAGLEDQDVRNFNIDWQNQQLGRQIAGVGAMGGAFGQGAQLQGNAAPLFMQSAMYPYQTSQNIFGNQENQLTGLGQFGVNAATIPGQQLAGNLNYLNYGNNVAGQNNALAQTYLQQANQGAQQQAGMMGGIGRLAGTLGGAAIGSYLGNPMMGAQIGNAAFGGQPKTGWGF